jgi:hypothetical protein
MTPRPHVTNRGLWYARHIRLTHAGQPCPPGCVICAELYDDHPDYTTPPPPRDR